MTSDKDEIRDFLLLELEKRVGDRDSSWTLKETAYTEKNPYTQPLPNKNIIIYVIKNSEGDIQQLYFQLSHEVVHLLDPIEREKGTNFEEGIASYNSVYECNKHYPDYPAEESVCDEDKYKKCLDLIRKIGNADEIYAFVKKIRKNGNGLSSVSKDVLKELEVWTDDEIDFLVSKFN